jgi:hypothetical protein
MSGKIKRKQCENGDLRVIGREETHPGRGLYVASSADFGKRFPESRAVSRL